MKGLIAMGLTLTEKILKAHLVDGEMVKGKEIGIRIDQTLTQDATGTMAYLEFEAMGVSRVKTEKSVAYIDHNTLQNALKTPTTTALSEALQKSTVFIFHVPETAFAIRYILSASEFPEKPLSLRQPYSHRRRNRYDCNRRGGLDVAVAWGAALII